jgi:hypothetical protein
MHTHGSLKIYDLPILIILPQSGILKGIPAPKKLRVDIKRAVLPVFNVPSTTIGVIVLGNICLNIILNLETPITLAASIKSLFFTLNVSPRAILAKPAQRCKHMMREIVRIDGPKMTASIKAKRIIGNAIVKSTALIISVSTLPPK